MAEERWTPGLRELALTTRWTIEDWQEGWDTLDSAFKTKWYFPAWVGMVNTFGFHPKKAAHIINEANDGK